MSYRTYLPKRGDLVHLNFSPSAGHELASRHYGLIISASSYNRKRGMSVVCGITSRVRGGPFEVELPLGLLPEKRGAGQVRSVIVADSVRQVDFREREMQLVVAAPRHIVEEVIHRLFTVLEDE